MKTIGKAYGEFQKIVAGNAPAPKEDFRKICHRIGVSPSDLNEILEEEFGKDGFEIVHYFGNGNNFY